MVDGLTATMLVVVSTVSFLVHLFSSKYLEGDIRYGRYYCGLLLFTTSMLGLVLANSLLFLFIFWELVGLSSYLLIGHWFEKKSASNAAIKAFLTTRIGDLGMFVGLMICYVKVGSLEYADLFAAVQTGTLSGSWQTIAGLGIFFGAMGKSAQVPLHVWLPDAMEGPTPVSALVHSATMVAAGVYLVGRFYPVFAPEVLLVIAVTGGITLFLAATIALTATDIKRVLAYSTVSQLGYMMLALGVGGWLAGMLHLVTHAFFKSLLFLCSGSVIHALHSNEMTVMGGLRKKMPITAATMLVGCLAITGLSIPFVIGLSGYYSKDMILEQAFSFARENPGLLGDGFFIVAAGGAAMTAFYMFRLWFLTFAGEPRDAQRYAHAHESPRVMYVPLIILAVFAAGVAWPAPFGWPSLQGLLEQARPAGTAVTAVSAHVPFVWPSEYIAHDAANYWSIVVPVTWLAFLMAVAGLLVAVAMYVTGQLSAREVSRQFAPLHRFLLHKWWFDELYDLLFVRPLYVVAGWCAAIDRRWIDGLIDHSARWTARLAAWSQWLGDHTLIDGFVDRLAAWTYRVGVSLRSLQTGSLRQYVLFLVIGVVAVFLISSFL